MSIGEFLSGFVPLIVLGAFGWLAVRLLGKAKESVEVDPAVAVRQLIIYGLAFVTMIFGAVGVTSVYGELADRAADSNNAGLAQGLAMVAIGIPIFAVLLAVIDRRLAADQQERNGIIWAAYLNITLVITLITTMVFGARLISDVLDTSIYARVDGSDVVAAVAWGSLWAVHWGVLRHRHGVRGDLHYAVGSVIGGVTMAAGITGLAYVAFDWIYTQITDDPLLERAGPSTETLIATFAVGAPVWLWFWFSEFRHAPRTESWYVTAIPVGALSGFAAAIAASASAGYQTLVWFFGNPSADEAVRHFDQLPFLASAFVVGGVSWGYNRRLIGSEGVRNDPQRVYDYTLAAAALVSAVIGLVMLLSGLVVPSDTDANDVIAGLMAALIGGPLWLYYWRAIGSHVEENRQAELQSPLRRVYVYLVVGVSAVAVLISGITALQSFFEDMLDDVLSTDTLSENRFRVATLIVLAGVVWYHAVVMRGEREDYEEPVPPPPPPPPRTRRVMMLGWEEGDELAKLGHEAGVRFEYLHRTDKPDQPVDNPSELVKQILDQPGEDLLVMTGGEGPTFIGLEPS